MKEAELQTDTIGIFSIFEQISKMLGFHNLGSFFTASIFLIIALAFIISCVIFFIKKRKERLAHLEQVVKEIQEPKISKPLIKQEKAESLVEVEVEAETKKPKEELSKTELGLKKEVAKHIEEPVLEIVVPPKRPDAGKELGAALKNTRLGFMEKLSRFFSRNTELSDEDFEEMEAILFTADIGAKTAQKLLDTLQQEVKKNQGSDKVCLRSILKAEMLRILESADQVKQNGHINPQVIMFVGVNGAGKTTTIGKLGARLKDQGYKVTFGAGDTFRAAAVKQLSIWGDRVGAVVVSGQENQDSASVLFDAIEKAKAEQSDYVLCDTAGRLHTKTGLMDELKKVYRVLGKAQPKAPHEVFLVIDATMGQNALTQAREFAAATPLTGVILSKLDGTAKGGMALGIVDELKVPIRYIGIGEKEMDLKDFDAKLFVDALFEEA
jgi:fused signal recognition particle receptor